MVQSFVSKHAGTIVPLTNEASLKSWLGPSRTRRSSTPCTPMSSSTTPPVSSGTPRYVSLFDLYFTACSPSAAECLSSLAPRLRARIGPHTDSQGPPASASALTSSAPSAPAAPTAPTASKSAPTASAGAGGQSALLAALNRGGDITSGLKKVDKSQMTHKNPELRQSSAVPASASGTDKKSPPEIKAKPGALVRGNSVVQKKPAKTELEGGNKWSVVRWTSFHPFDLLAIVSITGLASGPSRTGATCPRASAWKGSADR